MEQKLNIETPLESAKKLIEQENQKIVNEAVAEYNSLIKAWKEKHNCSLVIENTLINNVVNSTIKVIQNQQ